MPGPLDGTWDAFNLVNNNGMQFDLGKFEVKNENIISPETQDKPEKAGFVLTHTPATGPAKGYTGIRLSKHGKHLITFTIEHENFRILFSGTLNVPAPPRFLFGSYQAARIVHTAAAAKSSETPERGAALAFDPGDTGTWGGSQGT